MDNRVEEFNRLQREAARPRLERIKRLRAAGETWTAIGKLLGISRQRAQALARAANMVLANEEHIGALYLTSAERKKLQNEVNLKAAKTLDRIRMRRKSSPSK